MRVECKILFNFVNRSEEYVILRHDRELFKYFSQLLHDGCSGNLNSLSPNIFI